MLATALLVLTACNSPDAPDFLKSTGRDETQRRDAPGPIRRIVADDDLNILLTPDTGQGFELTGGANLLPKIRTDYELADSSLHVYNANTFNWLRDYGRPVTLRLPAGRLTSYRHGGYGSLACADTLRLARLRVQFYGTATGTLLLAGQVLEVDANGYGEFTLAGRARYTYLFTLKTAEVQAQVFRTRLADLDLGSRRPATLTVTDSVHAILSSSGDALIYGNPRHAAEGAGPGRLILYP